MDQPKRRRRRGAQVFLLILLILAVLVILAFMVFQRYFSLLNRRDAGSFTAETPVSADSTAHEDANSQQGVYSILLLGVDAREDSYDTRTDTMMLLSVNRSTKKIVLSSFLRDTYISIPNYGFQRLNVANAVGGPAKTIETIEANYGVAIDNYAFVNFYSFIKVVDAMGGVDLSLTDDEVYYVNLWVMDSGVAVDSSLREQLAYREDGQYHLSGTQSLAFCRTRNLGYDMGRTNNQRRMISALLDKAKSMSLPELSNMMEVILPEITTDVSAATGLLQLASMPAYRDYELVSLQVPGEGSYTPISVDGASMLNPDLETNRQLLYENIFG